MDSRMKLAILKNMKPHTTILYRGCWGDGDVEEAKFLSLSDKNGEYIVNVEIHNGSIRWGYLYQIALI